MKMEGSNDYLFYSDRHGAAECGESRACVVISWKLSIKLSLIHTHDGKKRKGCGQTCMVDK